MSASLQAPALSLTQATSISCLQYAKYVLSGILFSISVQRRSDHVTLLNKPRTCRCNLLAYPVLSLIPLFTFLTYSDLLSVPQKYPPFFHFKAFPFALPFLPYFLALLTSKPRTEWVNYGYQNLTSLDCVSFLLPVFSHGTLLDCKLHRDRSMFQWCILCLVLCLIT